jgi:hypothetical protein
MRDISLNPLTIFVGIIHDLATNNSSMAQASVIVVFFGMILLLLHNYFVIRSNKKKLVSWAGSVALILILAGVSGIFYSGAVRMQVVNGGKGGDAYVVGHRSGAVAGNAGKSGLSLGGNGGDAKVMGDDSFAFGGNGSNSAQVDGSGGERTISPAERLGLPTSLWNLGFGASGRDSGKYTDRMEVLIQARLKYMNDFPEDARRINAGLMQVPLLWVNLFLKERGEEWRVSLKDGVYLLPSLDGKDKLTRSGSDSGSGGEMILGSLNTNDSKFGEIRRVNIEIGKAGLNGMHGTDSVMNFFNKDGIVVKSVVAKGGASRIGDLPDSRYLEKSDLENGFQISSLFFANSVKIENNLFEVHGGGWDYYSVTSAPYDFFANFVFKVSAGKLDSGTRIKVEATLFDPQNIAEGNGVFLVSKDVPTLQARIRLVGNELGFWRVKISSGDIELAQIPLEIRLKKS